MALRSPRLSPAHVLAPGLAGLPISFRDRRSVRPAGGAEPPLPLLALGAFAGGVLGGLMWLALAWFDFWVVVGLATLARYGWR